MGRRLALGLNLGYWAGGPPADTAECVRVAEECGFTSVWTAEAYGSDALTPLAWWGAATRRVRLGTAVAQIAARAPAATAMAAMTLDHLSGGRMVLGLGVSGPRVVEGWYGVPFDPPLARMREYVDILHAVWRRDAPATAPGPHLPLPLPGSTLGVPLRSSLKPLRPRVPVMIGAERPRGIALAAEIADGWLALFQSPRRTAGARAAMAAGFDRRRPDLPPPADFEVVVAVPVVVDDDVERAADTLRPMYALYIGGMGPKGRNTHADAVMDAGWEEAAVRVRDLYLDGHRDAAAAAVPTALIEDLALIGPAAKIRHDLEAWRDSYATELSVSGTPATLSLMAELVLG